MRETRGQKLLLVHRFRVCRHIQAVPDVLPALFFAITINLRHQFHIAQTFLA